MTNLKDYFMSEIALVITILLVIYWIFRPNSGNYHLRDKEQEIEDYRGFSSRYMEKQ